MHTIAKCSKMQFPAGKLTSQTIMTSILQQANSANITLFKQVEERGNSLQKRKKFNPLSDSVYEGSDHESDYENEVSQT